MSKTLSTVILTACLFLFNAPVQATVTFQGKSNCAYGIAKLQAQIRYQQNVMDTTAASNAAADALAYDAKTEAFKAKGATADAEQSDAACRKAVLAGWAALRG
jgi:hypothetical protein